MLAVGFVLLAASLRARSQAFWFQKHTCDYGQSAFESRSREIREEAHRARLSVGDVFLFFISNQVVRLFDMVSVLNF
jgi:hypothetical protein